MNVTTDIYPRIAVDVVIFTVVENETLPGLESLGLLRPEWVVGSDASGLSLFVVTMQGETGRMLPGGLLDQRESIEAAARRISHESLGVSLKTKLRGLGTFDDPSRDPHQRTISFPYWGMVNFEDIRQYLGGRDRVGLELVSSKVFMDRFYNPKDLANLDGVSRFGNRTMPDPKRKIAHSKRLTRQLPWGQILELDHDEMVFYAWRALRHAFESKLDPFSYLSINPLGEEFRISDLQEFQEVCRGERLQRDTFRRAMLSDASYLRKTVKSDSSRPGKPANLYSLMAPPPRHEPDSTDER